MRILSILCLSLLYSCTKEDIDLGPYYQQFMGKWACVNSTEKIELDVRSKGTIKIKHEIERGKKIVAQKWKLSDTLNFYNSEFVGGSFIGKNEEQISLYLSLGKDSLICGSVTTNINQYQLEAPYKIQVFIKVN